MADKPRYTQLFAGWIKKTRNGEDFLSLAIGDDVTVIVDGEQLTKGDWIQIWKNKRKFSPQHPDFVLLKKTDGNYDSKYVKKISDNKGTPKSEPDVLIDEIEDALR